MSKNNKKAPSLGTLIPLGQKNKPRPATTSQSTAKKIKIEDFNPSTVISTIEQSMKQDNGTSETLIINFLNSVKSTLITSSKNGKILPSQCLALFSICKKFPILFTKATVVDCMCGILAYNGKDSSNPSSSNYPQKLVQAHSVTAMKLKQLHIAICGMLLASFKDHQKWPIQLVKSYLDDSFADRVWVDLPECNLLVRNIETAFPTPGIDPRTFSPLATISEQLAQINDPSEISLSTSDSVDGSEVNVVETINKVISALTVDDLIKPRFEHSRMSVEAMVSGYIKETLERKYIPEPQIKNTIRAFCSLAGLAESRGSVVTKLDNWLLGKHQSVALNMLTIMANSCNQNIAQNPHDIAFSVYLMLKFKYKTSKPAVQISLLECIKRISEMHPNNLRNMLHIYVNNELYSSPTVTHGVTINQVTATTTASSSSHLLVNKAISVTLPAIYFRFPTESIKILGDLLHEQLCINFNDIKPVKVLIRDLCRWIKCAHANSGGVYNSFTNTGLLPDCLELLDLAQSLLADRNASESLTSRMGDSLFKQSYVDNIINVLCELQMLSIVRPSVREAFKERSDHEKKDLESIRHHYTTLRQIRYLACKWLKIIFRLVGTQIPSERMTFYLKQVMFLNVARSNDQNYIIDDSYAINEILSNETDKMTFVKGLTEIPLSEKLIQTMITLGFEKHMCYRPAEIVEMLSELIIRASACATTDIMPMNVTKGETIINNMFACCSYDISLEDNDPKLQVAKTLAYKGTFWKVCQALVIMACHCTDTCGAFLWANYPTIKNLMKIVITNNFENGNIDEEALETERMHCETEAVKILELESSLYNDSGDDAVLFDPGHSKLISVLMLNLPQGATRQPPQDVLISLKSINSLMKIGDRLSQCRSPDFLLEIVKGQDQTKSANRKWIIDLVKKTSEHNVDGLPLLCLTEFIYHDLSDKITSKVPITAANDTFRRLVLQIRLILAGGGNGGKSDAPAEGPQRIVAALSNSFFARLSDASASTRQMARECLYMLLQPDSSLIGYLPATNGYNYLDTLKTLVTLTIFQDKVIIGSMVDSLKETLKFETDIAVLRSYLELFASMSAGGGHEWLVGLVDVVAVLLLQRPIIVDQLMSMDHQAMKLGQGSPEAGSGLLVCELLAEIFLAYIGHVTTQPVIGIDNNHQPLVMVAWRDKTCPISVRVVQAQLWLLCQAGACSGPLAKQLPPQCKKLADLWFLKVAKTYELPAMSECDDGGLVSVEGSVPVVTQWLMDLSVASGVVAAMTAIVNYQVRHNHSVRHRLSPAMAMMPADFVGAYVKMMNSVCKDQRPLMEQWLTEVDNIDSLVRTIERIYGKVKRISTMYLEQVRHHSMQSTNQMKASIGANEERPVIIVAPIPKNTTIDNDASGGGDQEMMAEGELVTNVWSDLIRSAQESTLPINAISGAIDRLLSITDGNGYGDDLIKLLKDPKTHSEILRVLNKSDYRLLPLLRLTFRCEGRDQARSSSCADSFQYLFNSYPHVEKLSVWKMAYRLCVTEHDTDQDESAGPMVGTGSLAALSTGGDSYSGLVKAIMDGGSGNSGAIIDRLTVLGLGNCGPDDDGDQSIRRLLFSSHCLYRYSAYFLSDLLHQSSLESLRAVLHSLLARRALSNLHSSRTLDFIDACIHHPRLQFPGSLLAARRHLWPQQNVSLELTDSEVASLLSLVVAECEHLVQRHGLTSGLLDSVLADRCRLVEVATGHREMLGRRATVIGQFLASHSGAAIQRLTAALYWTMPSLVTGECHGIESSVALLGVGGGAASTDAIHRTGQRLLAGLASSRPETQDLAIQAIKALALRHGGLCVQLLPLVTALADGALDSMEPWTTFKRKRGNVLYSCLLQLLEMMGSHSLAPTAAVRRDVAATLANFLRLLIRYREQAAVFGPMVTRLVHFLEQMTPLAGESSFVSDHLSEIVALSRVYHQFKSLVGDNSLATMDSADQLQTTSTTSIAAAPRSLSLAAQLDSLDQFRAEIAKYQFGAGLAQSFKVLQAANSDQTISCLCVDDVRAALANGMDEVRMAARQCLVRYLTTSPDQAPRILTHCLVPGLMRASYYWASPFANLALSTLRHTAMLAPDLAASCLTRYGRLFIAGNNGRGNYKDSVALIEEIIDNVCLESFMDSDLDVVSTTSLMAPVSVAKDTVVTAAMATSQKRHYQMSPVSDHDTHKAKRSRFK